jgi:hypothetical protein
MIAPPASKARTFDDVMTSVGASKVVNSKAVEVDAFGGY